MDILEDLKKIVKSGDHYLKVLNNINSYLFNEGYVKYSAFYFYRGEKEYLVAEVGQISEERSIKIEIPKKKVSSLGYWQLISDIDSGIFEEIVVILAQSIFFAEWEYSFSFTQNRSCEYFPCHSIKNEDAFSCLFCYCPLYLIPDCGGDFSLLPNGMKDCSSCLLPHKEESYKYIVEKLSSYHKF